MTAICLCGLADAATNRTIAALLTKPVGDDFVPTVRGLLAAK